MRSFIAIAVCCLLLAGLVVVSYSGAQDRTADPAVKKAVEAVKSAKAEVAKTAHSADQTAIESVNAEFVQAFNAGDATALSTLFTEDARMSDETGKTVEGRAAIKTRLEQSFREAPGAKLVLKTNSVKLLGSDVAIEEGASQPLTAGADAAAADFTPYTAVFVKQNGKWLHAVVRDYILAQPDDSASPSGQERLKELDWMIGEWVEEGTDSKSLSTCGWAQNKNFLVWNYTVEAAGANAPGGTMFIGWDPLTKQIKSWLFDADGGHGEATWTSHGDGQWVVKAAGVLGDGRSASATQYITVLGKDRASWTSVDRVAGGDVQPDMSEYIIARKPPSPAPATKSPKSR